jgi:hypothetical protein
VLYFAAAAYNLALFTYDAATNELFFLVRRTGVDLPMYWYGWIVTSANGASVAGAIASLIPDQWTQQLWSGWSWAIPMAVILAFCYLLRGYFIR